jgi:hypothetical protein
MKKLGRKLYAVGGRSALEVAKRQPDNDPLNNDDECFICEQGGGKKDAILFPQVDKQRSHVSFDLFSELVCCDYCSKSYHVDCHIPERWKCCECLAPELEFMRCGECEGENATQSVI